MNLIFIVLEITVCELRNFEMVSFEETFSYTLGIKQCKNFQKPIRTLYIVSP